MPNLPTFYYFNGRSTSTIELFIHRKSEAPISNITSIISPYDPVTVEILVQPPKNSKPLIGPKQLPVPAAPSRVRCEKVDEAMYLNRTELRLQALRKNIHQMPASIITERVNCILKECADTASPPPPKRKRKANFKWHPSLCLAPRKASQCYHRLKGLLYDSQEYHIHKAIIKVAKKLLRKAQRQLAAGHKREIVSIMDACLMERKKLSLNLLENNEK